MLLQQYNYIGIDLSAEYINISKARIDDAMSSILKDKQSKDKQEEDTCFLFDNV